ncbi:MAG: hypothetical protein KatS3mg051_1828 [Anaerolineae bacterium]|nr:MAG: hypothetical protein KatS3mg051_1828 [Anaerolineae bacterium]
MKHYYGVELGMYGAALQDGRLIAHVYVFSSREDRDHWVADRSTEYVDMPGFRWSATRSHASRTTGWSARGPYIVQCPLCGRSYDDDCEAYRCTLQHRDSVVGSE